jgi:predicted nuclease of restriction endonuclease-like (RecB) superfamily
MTSDLVPQDYADWLASLKTRIHQAQQRASLAVNRELIALYWQIGRDILSRQAAQGWGAKVIQRLSTDLRNAFPEMKGFSRANLLYMRAFAEAWPDPEIVQQAVGQLPWGHNILLSHQDEGQREIHIEPVAAGEAANKPAYYRRNRAKLKAQFVESAKLERAIKANLRGSGNGE